MTDETGLSMRPQPMIAVADVEAASRWYQHVLGAASGHGGAEYEQLLVDGQLIMQLHRFEIGHHHGTIGDPGQPTGNGVAPGTARSGSATLMVTWSSSPSHRPRDPDLLSRSSMPCTCSAR